MTSKAENNRQSQTDQKKIMSSDVVYSQRYMWRNQRPTTINGFSNKSKPLQIWWLLFTLAHHAGCRCNLQTYFCRLSTSFSLLHSKSASVWAFWKKLQEKKTKIELTKNSLTTKYHVWLYSDQQSHTIRESVSCLCFLHKKINIGCMF